MSEENVEIVRRVFEIVRESVLRGDHGAAFDKAVREGLLTSRFKLAVRGSLWEVRGGKGREDYVEFMRRWTEDFDDLVFEPDGEIVDADKDRVVAIARWHGTGKRSRVPVQMRMAWLYTLKGGRIERADIYTEPNSALKAAGLRE
jgi:ketosteroid isomerase-like protein